MVKLMAHGLQGRSREHEMSLFCGPLLTERRGPWSRAGTRDHASSMEHSEAFHSRCKLEGRGSFVVTLAQTPQTVGQMCHVCRGGSDFVSDIDPAMDVVQGGLRLNDTIRLDMYAMQRSPGQCDPRLPPPAGYSGRAHRKIVRTSMAG